MDAIERQSFPEIRIIPIAPDPLGVESATIVFTVRMYDTSFSYDLLIDEKNIKLIYSTFPKEKR